MRSKAEDDDRGEAEPEEMIMAVRRTFSRDFYRVEDLVPNKIFPGSRSMLYKWIKAGKFPKPTRIGRNAWPIEVVDAWQRLLKESMQATAAGNDARLAAIARKMRVVSAVPNEPMSEENHETQA
jgi:hypothetical protein